MNREYKVERIPIDNAEDVSAFLHVAGMTGWELVAVLPTTDPFNRSTLAIFKRGPTEQNPRLSNEHA